MWEFLNKARVFIKMTELWVENEKNVKISKELNRQKQVMIEEISRNKQKNKKKSLEIGMLNKQVETSKTSVKNKLNKK